MNERIVLDTSAVVELFRTNVPSPALREATAVSLPLPALGELFVGAFGSRQKDHNLTILEQFIAKHHVLNPDQATARLYGELRVRLGLGSEIGASKKNDLWIAALAIQHDLPLLTSDGGFDTIPRLRVIHW